MDYTAKLRTQKEFIKTLANADLAISAGKFDDAENEVTKAKRLNESDYGLWIISAKQNMAKERFSTAVKDLDRAKVLKPGESLPGAQAR